MTERAQPTDLELAALISSKICHDVIGPVGAFYNGLEILDEDDDAQAKTYALDVIRNVTEQASARLQFARFAFGAAGSAAAAPEGTMTWGVHITLASRWLDPGETEGIATPFMVLYALHDALVKPMPAGINTPSRSPSSTTAPTTASTSIGRPAS